MLPIVEQMAMMESGRCMVADRGESWSCCSVFCGCWYGEGEVGLGWLELMNEEVR
jgi:hypothetical protein